MRIRSAAAGAAAMLTAIATVVAVATPAQADSRWKQCVPVQASKTGASIKGTLCIGHSEWRVAGWVKDTASDDRQAVFRIRWVQHFAPGWDMTHTNMEATTGGRPAGSTVHFDNTYYGDLKALKAQPCTQFPQTCTSRWYG